MSFDRLGDHRRQQAQDLFRLGRTCVKSGDKARGRELLLKAVEYDRDLAEAWVWLSGTPDDQTEQKKYLEWAVAADPANALARRGLAILNGQLKREEVLPEGAGVAPRAPAEPEAVQVDRTYDCPQCGGRMRFDTQLVDLKCAHCGFVQAVDEVTLKDGARPLDFALPTARGHRWAEGERRFTCSQCGAATLLPAGGKSTACPFCGNAALVAAPEEAELLAPDGLIPMALEAETATQAVRRWLGRGFFAPDNLAELVRHKALRPTYAPFWVFEATLTAHWSAEVAEGYGRNRRWVPRTGEHTTFFRERLQPASRSVARDLFRRLPTFDLKKLLEFKPEYLADWPTALYDIALADASLNARAEMVKAAQQELRYKAAPGQDIRNLQTSTDHFSGELYKLVLLPLWIGTYAYRGRPYQVLVNGQTGAVNGDKPVDGVKVALITAAVVIVVAFLLYLLWYFTAR